MSDLRRYEIFLPLRFNDGRLVPDDLIAQTLLELRERFGAVSWETQIIHGAWQHERVVFRDDLVRVFVDVPDLSTNRQFFLQFKDRLKTRFGQIEIWMSTYAIEVL